jgi:transcriptional regulator GlxA family with amidase domain
LEAERLILETLSRPTSSDPRVLDALTMLESEAATGRRLTSESIAADKNVDSAHLGGVIKSATGFKFTAWRSAFLLRPALRPLVETNDDVKQIACTALGYKHLSQFVRDFHQFFGITPTSFRQVCIQRD